MGQFYCANAEAVPIQPHQGMAKPSYTNTEKGQPGCPERRPVQKRPENTSPPQRFPWCLCAPVLEVLQESVVTWISIVEAEFVVMVMYTTITSKGFSSNPAKCSPQ
ncbi:hypothetical protein MHYP_G00055660 [Metynnis hypsauchen]